MAGKALVKQQITGILSQFLLLKQTSCFYFGETRFFWLTLSRPPSLLDCESYFSPAGLLLPQKRCPSTSRTTDMCSLGSAHQRDLRCDTEQGPHWIQCCLLHWTGCLYGFVQPRSPQYAWAAQDLSFLMKSILPRFLLEQKCGVGGAETCP